MLRLSPEEKQDPILALHDFFDLITLDQTREEMWTWLVAAIGKDEGPYDEGRKRSDLLLFYRQLERILEAAWLISQQNNSSKA